MARQLYIVGVQYTEEGLAEFFIQGVQANEDGAGPHNPGQVTALGVMALPGKVHSFSAKSPAGGALLADNHPFIRGIANNRTTLRGIEGMRVGIMGVEGNRTSLRGDV